MHIAQAKEVEAKIVKPTFKNKIHAQMYDKVVAKWSADQWPAMEYVMNKETSGDPKAINKSSGACGIPQSLPCSKMLKVIGSLDNVNGQLDWMVNYIASRYDNPKGAEKFHKINNWY